MGHPFPPPLPPTAHLLERYWAQVPLALALREVHRLLALAAIFPDRPQTARLLDVGVGDGAWWQHLHTESAVLGIDINEHELSTARRRLPNVAKLDVSSPNLADQLEGIGWGGPFDGILANCSLEHVPDLDAALQNIVRVLAPGGWLCLFVPTPWWAMQGRMQSMLARHAPRLAMMNAGAMNGFFQHWHLMDRPTWTRLLQSHGLEVTQVLGMGDARSEFLFRLALPTSLAAFLGKQLTGRYPKQALPAAALRPLAASIAKWLEPAILPAQEVEDHSAYEFAIRCRRPL